MDYLKHHKNTLPNDWSTKFTTYIFEEFIILKSIKTNLNVDIASTSSSFTPTIVLKQSLYNNKKVDIEAYPAFNGLLKDWKKFKVQCNRITTIHRISYEMN